MDHLFLNCRVAHFLWKFVFSWFDVSGVLPSNLSHLFNAWNLGVGLVEAVSCGGLLSWLRYGLSGRRETTNVFKTKLRARSFLGTRLNTL